MAGRKLTRKQKFRIDRIQKEKAARVEKQAARADALLDQQDGELCSGLVIAHFGRSTQVEIDGQVVDCHKRANLPALVTGDQVSVEKVSQEEAVVVACHERRSLLNRPDVRGRLRPVAANIDCIYVVVAPEPETPANLIDRYLVACHASEITPVLVFNKWDLALPGGSYEQLLREYSELGYACITASVHSGAGMDEFRSGMQNRNSVFVGQSGVGKSSLIRALSPDTELAVGDISSATGKGRHTTTTARLYHMPFGGNLIDSPGVREFGLWHVADDVVAGGFPELAELSARCRFRDCSHRHEPGCAIREAVAAEAVLPRRYESLLTILDSLHEVQMHQ